MNAIKFWIALLTLSTVASAHAVVVDFEDLSAGNFGVGGSFSSAGISFDVIAYNGVGGGFFINKTTSPPNTQLNMANSTGINVILPANTNLIEFDYFDHCSGCSTTGITVNGVASSPTIQLTALDGTTLGGVAIEVIAGSGLTIPNHLTLSGPITSFATGGTEYLFDNLRITVPEPTTGILAICGIAGFSRRRKR